jgi:translocator protein
MPTTDQAPGRTITLAMLVLFFLLSFAAASTGYFFPPGEWYASLTRPAFAPPDWLFGPVWTLLYVMIAVAGWLVWRSQGWASPLIALWLVQMGLNALWTPIFFGLNMPGLALIEMVMLWMAIAACVVSFQRHVPAAGWLMLPYLVWVSFALLLNIGFWWLN